VLEKNALDIVRAIEAFMDEKVRASVGAEARKKVEGNYTWMHSAKSVESVYRKVIDG
jgi:glycosyltransferase involved in cell wall biosynthesis